MNIYLLSSIKIVISFLLTLLYLNGKSIREVHKISFSKEEFILFYISTVTILTSYFIKEEVLSIIGLYFFYALLLVEGNNELQKFKTCTIFLSSIVFISGLLYICDSESIKFFMLLIISFQTSFYLKFGNLRHHFLKNIFSLTIIINLTDSIYKTLIYTGVYIGLEIILSLYTKRMILLKNQNLITISTRISQFALILIAIDKVIK